MWIVDLNSRKHSIWRLNIRLGWWLWKLLFSLEKPAANINPLKTEQFEKSTETIKYSIVIQLDSTAKSFQTYHSFTIKLKVFRSIHLKSESCFDSLRYFWHDIFQINFSLIFYTWTISFLHWRLVSFDRWVVVLQILEIWFNHFFFNSEIANFTTFFLLLLFV